MVVDEDEAPVPDVPEDAELPVPVPDDEPLMLPLVPLLELLEGLLMLPELLGVDDELDEDDGVVLLDVSVDDDELDDAGGVAGGVTVVLLLLLEGGVVGTTVVFSSLRSHAATLSPIATASALANKVLDFMGTPFKLCVGTKTGGRTAALSGLLTRKFGAMPDPCAAGRQGPMAEAVASRSREIGRPRALRTEENISAML